MKQHTLNSVRDACRILTESKAAAVEIGNVTIARSPSDVNMALSLGNVRVAVYRPPVGQTGARALNGRFNDVLPTIVAMVNGH